jgi:hypothetical protein
MDPLLASAVARDSFAPLAVLWPWPVRRHISKMWFSHRLVQRALVGITVPEQLMSLVASLCVHQDIFAVLPSRFPASAPPGPMRDQRGQPAVWTARRDSRADNQGQSSPQRVLRVSTAWGTTRILRRAPLELSVA